MAIDLQELLDLPPKEKLELVNMLCDDLYASGITLPEAEMEEIRRRYEEAQAHPERLLTTEQMWAKVDELRK